MKVLLIPAIVLAMGGHADLARAEFVGWVEIHKAGCAFSVTAELTTSPERVRELRGYYQRDSGFPHVAGLSEFVHVRGPGWVATADALAPSDHRGSDYRYHACGASYAAGYPSRAAAVTGALERCRRDNPGTTCCVTHSGFDDNKTNTTSIKYGLKDHIDSYSSCRMHGKSD